MKRKGFTLIEILVVAVIVGILSAVAIPAYNGYIVKASDLICEHTAATVLKSVIAFIQDRDPKLDLLGRGIHRNLDELNAILGEFRVKLPKEFDIDVFIEEPDVITVFIQENEYMGSASIGT